MDDFQPSRITSRIAPDDDGNARTLRGIHLKWSTVRACCARCSVRSQNRLDRLRACPSSIRACTHKCADRMSAFGVKADMPTEGLDVRLWTLRWGNRPAACG
jgi:hypothetical protein